ncbi:hypothetical protein [Desulfococcus sp.]|uniref:hypothetical protein n=1 Tax=Desulfococcus sp. TaxID=2025834 RepID=UPI003593F1C4
MKTSIAIGMIIIGLVYTTAALASDVVQGECVEFNANIIKIQEFDTHFSPESKYGKPTDVQSEYDVSRAEIGMKPEAGDILRIAYKLDGDQRTALKVMNVSKQDLMKK